MSKINELLESEDTKDVEVKTAPKKENKKEEGITLSMSEWEKLQERMDRLESVANKARLENYDSAKEYNGDIIYKIRVIDGKVVKYWSDLITNKVNIDPETRKYTEDQKLKVYLEDDTEEEMSLVVFNRKYKHIKAVLVEETALKDPEKMKVHGDRIFKLRTLEGDKEYIIGEKFVN